MHRRGDDEDVRPVELIDQPVGAMKRVARMGHAGAPRRGEHPRIAAVDRGHVVQVDARQLEAPVAALRRQRIQDVFGQAQAFRLGAARAGDEPKNAKGMRGRHGGGSVGDGYREQSRQR